MGQIATILLMNSSIDDKKNLQKITLRISPDFYAYIEKQADQRLRSINNEMLALLKRGLVSEKEETIALAEADERIAQFSKKDK